MKCSIKFAALWITLTAVCCLGVPAYAQTGNRYALVIGNAAYRNMDPLVNTINDAQDIAAALRRLGYEVDLKNNVTQLQMVDAVDAYVTKLNSRSSIEGFFWYAGHGVQIGGENYLLPVDVSMDSENRVKSVSYPLNDLLDEFDKARNRVNVVVIDACRDNPFPASSRSAGTRGLAAVTDPPGDLFVMFSTNPGNKAQDGLGKRNSPFAEAFLKYIDEAQPLPMMAIDVTNQTLALTGQQQRPFSLGSIISEKTYSLSRAGSAPQPPLVVVKELRAETRNNIVRLTWTDFPNAQGPVYIFRSRQPFNGFLPSGIQPVEVPYGTQTFLDETTDGIFYYFVAASDGRGKRYEILIPDTNTIAVTVSASVIERPPNFRNFVQQGSATCTINSPDLIVFHPGLPIGTMADITNTDTGKTVRATVAGKIKPSVEWVVEVSTGVANAIGMNPHGKTSIILRAY